MALQSTTIRDFGGGWNVSDSDLNLTSKYQPVSDNVVRGIDGSLSPRQGMGLWADLATGTVVNAGTLSLSIVTVDTSPKLTITFPAAHGRANGDHITLSGIVADINGISMDAVNGTHGLLVVDADTITITVGEAATSGSTVVVNAGVVWDDNLIAGNIIHDHYFNRRLLLFTDIGEVASIDEAHTMTRLWGAYEAETLSTGLAPTRRCKHWSADTFKSTVVACNGYQCDKPLQIFDDFRVEYLVDKGSSSNAAVPKADYVVCLQGYVIFVRTEFGDPFLELSAKGTDGTFTRDPNPADAAEIDLSMITATVEPVLLGAAQIREKLFAAFYDKGMVGTLGVYNEAGTHQPDFSDTIAENGTVSHRTMISLGNDIFMCDYAGVPSVSISQQSGIFVPVRLSELIAPVLQRHLSVLSEETLRVKAFAVYNKNDRSYMLFLPIYDEVQFNLPEQPFVFNEDLRAGNMAIVRAPAHRLMENSTIVIEGAVAIGDLPAASVNGTRKVLSVIDENAFVVQLDGAPSSSDMTNGGGTAVKVTPINDETIGYVFEYNKEFKIRRWTRYRQWNFDCGCSSQRGKLFFCKGLRVYRMGDNEVPLYADFIGDYDHREWVHGTAYAVGTRVRDATEDLVYICNIAHVSPGAGTFRAYRDANLDAWSAYVGEPISWAAETPWSDMKQRGRNKVVKYVNMDTEGYGLFTLSAFTNKIRNNPTTNALMPKKSIEFRAGDAGGWGIQNPGNWGGGRRTREEKVWPFQIRGKLLRWRYSGQTTQRVRITSHTMYYMLGNIR